MEFLKELPPLTLSKYDIEFFENDVKRPCFTACSHIHSAIEIMYITSGRFEVEVGGKRNEACEGDFVLVRSNVIHSFYHPDENYGEYYVLKLTTQYLFSIFKGVEDTACLFAFLKSGKDDVIVFKSQDISSEIKNIWKRMIAEYCSRDSMMLLIERSYASVFVISMFREFFEQKDMGENTKISMEMIALIYRSIEYINLNYASDITAEKCAVMINLSYSYYAKLFKTVVGKTFKEYLSAIRLSKAYSILLETDIPVTDVAISCGYNSHAYFSAEYKKHYGKTPKETRKVLL